ncbi:MAG: transcriptional repressor [Lachnotalea sp.]
MQTLKYSRQREAIKEFLIGRTDHPTADTVYTNIRQEFPNISLGTVYRNLALLSEIGEVLKISTGEDSDRFDGNTMPHYHFICTECNSVIDMDIKNLDHINDLASKDFKGKIDGHITYFYGKCVNCMTARTN